MNSKESTLSVKRKQRPKQIPHTSNQQSSSNSSMHWQPRLSRCAQAYAKALTDPFGPTDEAPCIPDTITLPSYKFQTTVRGVFQIGTAGFGYVSYDPWLAVHNGATVAAPRTNAPVRFTQSAFSLAWFDPTIIPVGTAVAASNSMITVSQMQSGTETREFRLVGAGLRIRYSGTELNRGGRCVVYRNRANVPIDGLPNISSVLRDNFYSASPVDREWKTVTYAPSRSEDITYERYVDPITVNTIGFPIFLGLVESTPGNTFEFECTSHFEMIAGQVGLPITPSHADPTGFGAVTSSMPDRFMNAGVGLFKYVAANAANYLINQVSQLLPIEGKIAVAATKALPWQGPKVEEVDDHEEL